MRNSDFRTPVLYHRATETDEQRPLQSSYLTCILHTDRIGNVESVMFFVKNKKDGKL